jgi:hypothetical protein
MYVNICIYIHMYINMSIRTTLQASRSVMPAILENTYFSEDFETAYNKDNSKSDDTSDIIIKIKIIPLKMKCMKILVSHGDCVHTLPPHSILLGEDVCIC